ncbi:MAG TPA: ribosome silencing factor, partial [Bacteroidota bacterium]
MTSRTLAKKIAEFALSKKAYDVVMLDVRRLTSTADFFVVCSADSDTQVRAIADAVEQGSEDLGMPVWHTEGFQASTWIILDYVDVVVHVFHHEARGHYKLDRLWSDAKATAIEDTVETHQGTTRKPRVAKPKRSTA